jgi:hypothetical protein
MCADRYRPAVMSAISMKGFFPAMLLALAVCSGDLAGTETPSATVETEEPIEEPMSKKRKTEMSFTCPQCQLGFTSGTAIANHFRARPDHQPTSPETKELHRRQTYTYHERHKIVSELHEARAAGVINAPRDIALKYGINPSTLRNWYQF